MTEDIIEYLQEQMKEAYVTLSWQKGLLCLRCDPKGIPTLLHHDDMPWCPICGKDPLFHGPLLMDRTFDFSGISTRSGLRTRDQRWDIDAYRLYLEKSPDKKLIVTQRQFNWMVEHGIPSKWLELVDSPPDRLRGTKPSTVIIDEILDKEVFNGDRTATPPRRSSEELEQWKDPMGWSRRR